MGKFIRSIAERHGWDRFNRSEIEMNLVAKLLLVCYSIYLFQFSSGCWFVVTSGNTTYLVFGRDDESSSRQQPVIDWEKYNLAKQAFSTCDTDGTEGLTWDEIDACEDRFCGLLTIDCPTQDEFDTFDLDNDGNLTWDEYLEANFEMLDQQRNMLDEF